MVYLIVQSGMGMPRQYQFNNEQELNAYVENNYKGLTKLAITENVYFIHNKDLMNDVLV